MATGSGQELDSTRLVLIVLFLIVGGLFGRMFFQNYVSAPARAADRAGDRAELYRTREWLPPVPPGESTRPYYERTQLQLLREYIMTGDKQAKRRLIQNAKRRERAKHSLAIWGSLAVACISIVVVVYLGLPMLQERQA